MDPIEKLLSELTPARAGSGLDQAMTLLFDRANRRARRRRMARNGFVLTFVLAVGVSLGFRAGRSSVETGPTEITYVVRAAPAPAYFDYSTSSDAVLTGPVRMTVEVRPAATRTSTSGAFRGS